MIDIGTNFLYKGVLFLDDRQGIAQSKTDLLNWSIPVPEGFEVYLNLENDPAWYTYHSSYNEPDTGHFKRRVDNLEVDQMFTTINNSIENINNEITNIYNIIGSGGGGGGGGGTPTPTPTISLTVTAVPSTTNNERGVTIYPQLTWTLSKSSGGSISRSEYTSVTVKKGNNSPITIENPAVVPWTDESGISDNTTYTVTVVYDGLSYSKSVVYSFGTKTYVSFGITKEDSITNSSQLTIQKTFDNFTGSINYTWIVDCSVNGGQNYYFFMISPKSKYTGPSSIKMIVDGITTDYYTPPFSVTYNGREYYVFRCRKKQNGSSIEIQLKSYG